VRSVLTAKAAIFAQLKPVWRVLFVFHGVVVALLTFLAGKCDFDAHGLHLQKFRRTLRRSASLFTSLAQNFASQKKKPAGEV